MNCFIIYLLFVYLFISLLFLYLSDMNAQFFMKAPSASSAHICWAAVSAGRSARALFAQAFNELIPQPPPC